MKKLVCTFLALLMCLVLSLAMVSCARTNSDPEETTQNVTSDCTNPKHNFPYPNEWIDKNIADYEAEITLEDIEITEIYSDCFFAEYIMPLPYVFKINGVLSDEWCVGDHVSVTCTNSYTVTREASGDEYDRDHIEADLKTIEASDYELTPGVAYKPVIYLYPKEKTEVSVKLKLRGELLITNPAYDDGWQVTAQPDGTLTDSKGKNFDYLFWEGNLDAEYDLSKGFCVAGGDTEKFLNSALAKLGLNRSEADDFMDFWVEHMKNNPYNIISFQTTAYTDAAELSVIPKPDSVIRVYMVYRPSECFVELPEQQLTAPKRSGFTVVEWGGAVLK